MRYEAEPMSPSGWLAEQFKSIRDRIEAVERAVNTSASAPTALVSGASSITYGTSVTSVGPLSLVKYNGIVTLIIEFKTSAALGGNAEMMIFPAGFRPNKTVDTDLKLLGTALVSGNWVPMPLYIRGDLASLRIQGNQSLASGAQLAVQMTYPALA